MQLHILVGEWVLFPPVKTSLRGGEGKNSSGVSVSQHSLPKERVLAAKLSLLHPCDPGNYIVQEESEKVPTKLIKDSDECDDRIDDHRNVWIILQRHAGECVLHNEGISLVS